MADVLHQNNEPELVKEFDNTNRIVVIGASAGGMDALQRLVAALPDDFSMPIFIVWHMPPGVQGILPTVLNRYQKLFAANAVDREKIQQHRIYVAPPDHHMLIEGNQIRISKGPKENRFRPAVDPLFRSAASEYDSAVIGIVLSGALDDGSVGLRIIKEFGGTTIVQDPADAEVSSMPENAARTSTPDYVLPVSEIPAVLMKLMLEKTAAAENIGADKKDLVQREIEIAKLSTELMKLPSRLGAPSAYACPECHGVLFEINDGGQLRFRCHTGHAYSADTLLNALTEQIEESMWDAVRGIEESLFLLNRLGDELAAHNFPREAGKYFTKAIEVQKKAENIKVIIQDHEILSKEALAISAVAD